MYGKKDKTVTLRIPEKTKQLVQELADKNMRSFQDQVLLMIAQQLHSDHFKPTDYM